MNTTNAIAPASTKPSPVETNELLSPALAGNTRALQQLLHQLRRPIEGAVGATIGSGHADFDDVVQEALLRVQGALPSFRGDCSLASYARLIATREALRTRRRTGRRVAWILLDPDQVESAVSPSPGPSAFRDRVWQLVAELPGVQARAFVQRFGLGLSLAEIAEEGGVPVNTVRSRLIAARRTLQGLLTFRGFMLDA